LPNLIPPSPPAGGTGEEEEEKTNKYLQRVLFICIKGTKNRLSRRKEK